MDLLSKKDHSSMLDELMGANTSDVRRAKILSDLMTHHDTVHKTISEQGENFEKLKDESTKLVDVNRKLMSEVYSGGSGVTLGSNKEKSFSETVTISGFEKSARY